VTRSRRVVLIVTATLVVIVFAAPLLLNGIGLIGIAARRSFIVLVVGVALALLVGGWGKREWLLGSGFLLVVIAAGQLAAVPAGGPAHALAGAIILAAATWVLRWGRRQPIGHGRNRHRAWWWALFVGGLVTLGLAAVVASMPVQPEDPLFAPAGLDCGSALQPRSFVPAGANEVDKITSDLLVGDDCRVALNLRRGRLLFFAQLAAAASVTALVVLRTPARDASDTEAPAVAEG
jgi:hypothetical protein